LIMKKYIKKATALFLVCVVCFGVHANVFAAGDIRVKSDGLFIHLASKPIVEGDVVFLDVSDFGRAIKGTSSWDITTKTATVRKGANVLQYKTKTGTWTYNNGAAKTVSAPVIKDGIAYLPLVQVCKAFGISASWDKKTNVATINTSSDYLALSMTKTPDEGAKVYTYERAVATAIDNNTSITSLEDNITLLEKSQKLAEDSLEAAYAFAYPYSTLMGILRQTEAIENNINMIPITKTIYKDTSEAMVFNSMLSIESLALDKILLEEVIALDEQNIKNLELKLSLGVVSENEVRAAKLALEANKESLKLFVISQNAEIQALNGILKLDLKTNTVVLYEPTGKQFSVRNLDAFIDEKVKAAPTIKLKEMTVSQAEYKKNTSSYSIDETGLDLIQTENEYNAAVRDLADSKYNLEKSIRSLYNNLRQVEGRRASLAIELEKAINTYNNAVTSYEAGAVIGFQVDQARLGILKAEIDIAKNEITYEKLIFTLDKPYLSQ